MSERIGLVYATVDGQTEKIVQKIKAVFDAEKTPIELFKVEDFKNSISDFDKLIIGSSIRYGVHNKDIIYLIENNKPELEAIKSIFFSVNLVARKENKNKPDTNPYVVKFFKKIKWKPTLKEVFAGMLDYSKYGTFDRIMIQFIMWMTKGPTNKDTIIEYTNWKKVEEFAHRVIKL
jgi:menaquinone-dependent protoporphyrinogen oxidase